LPTGVVINEGGGFYVPYKDKPFVIYTTGEKGSCTVRLYASGQSGHAACPPDDLAMRKMAAAIARISEYQFPAYLTHVSEWFIQSLGLDPRKPAEELVREVSEWHDDMMLRLLNYNLFSEIHIHSFQVGEKVNVIPYQAEVLIEFRTLPHLQMSDIEQLLTTLLKDTGVTWEIEAYEQGFECDITHDIVRSFKTRMAQRGVDAEILPIFALGRTDGRFLGRFGANVYGFSPLYTDITFTEVLKKVHNHDESLSIQSLLFGTNVITDVLMDICFTKDERSDRNGLHD
jgi:acetylornithine deacetylase/succinyl-diaminopimelate desuccinylase-like protein